MVSDLHEILSYPFDAEMLLRKQRSLRRRLLAREGIEYVPKCIAILGGSTTADFCNMLEIFLLQAGIKPDFYESEYNRYYEECMFPQPALEEFRPEMIFIFTSMVNLRNLPMAGDSAAAAEQKLQAEYERYAGMWEALRQRYGAIVIQNNMELPYMCAVGSLDAALAQGQRHFVEGLNERFAAYAQAHADFYLHDLHYLSAQIGLRVWYNRFQYYAYKLAMSYEVIPYAANSAANLIKAILGRSRKCLVLDLDNTLWGGVIGDEGAENIALGHETPAGEAFLEFQQYVLALKQRGVLLAVCSKNEAETAKSGFSHPDSVLSLSDFVAFHANWEPKDQNICQIAKELNIGLESLVFVDDNPAERALVRESLPMVAVPEVQPEDVFSYIQALEGNGYFAAAVISQDDLQRNESYQQNQQRQELAQELGSYDDFLQSLAMKAEIAPFQPVYYERIAQLTNKSNQFNLTTRRYTLADIRRMAEDERYITLYGRLRDRFGDNGLVSVVIGEKKGKELHILLWLMSCRVLKRGMEQAMLDALAEQARAAGLERLVGYYYPTKKNPMVAELYPDFGFSLQKSAAQGTVWAYTLPDEYLPKNRFIEVGDTNHEGILL